MTNMTDLQRFFREKFLDTVLLLEEPLSEHTSFRIGGPCEILAFPKNTRELSDLLRAAKQAEIEPAVLGAGTNVLARDEGRRGLVICTKDSMKAIARTGETTIRAEAGVSMARLANFAQSLGLDGLTFAHGIPGTVGGGLMMNAGAYGGEMKQVAVSTEFMTLDGEVETYSGEAQKFSYRHSAFSEKKGVILAGSFALTHGDSEKIREEMRTLAQKRRTSQPLELPSAGSTFKRPQGGYAAALIDQAGLKGYRIGGAAVSEKHAGFVVNLGGATASDVLALVREIQRRVLETSGISLEPEIRLL